MSSNVLPMFSSKGFIVSVLTFRSLMHFEFIFVYGVRKCSNFLSVSFFYIYVCYIYVPHLYPFLC